MGPSVRYLGPLVPKETLIWQDPVPAVDHPLIDEQDIAALKAKILASGLVGIRSWSRPPGRRPRRSAAPTSAAAPMARAFASRRRRTGRSTSRPQLAKVLAEARSDPEGVQRSATGGKKVSLADLIVLGGSAAVEKAAKDGRHRREGAVHAGPHGRVAGADRRRILRAARAARRRLPQLRQRQAAVHAARGSAGRPGAVADADRRRR